MSGYLQRLLFFCLLLACWPVLAGTLVLRDGDNLEGVYFSRHMDRYTGSAPPADARAAAALPDSDFMPVGAGSPLQPRVSNWFRFSLHNEGLQARSLILDFDQGLLSQLEWYTRVGDNERYVLTGLDYPYASRDIDYNHFAFRLDVPPGATLVANVRIYTTYPSLLVPQLSDRDSYYRVIMKSNRFTGAVMGMLLVVCGFLLLYVTRTPPAADVYAMLVYAMLGFSLFSVLSVLYIAGVIQHWIPDSASEWRHASYAIIHCCQAIFFCLVLRYFYQTARDYPWFNRLLLMFIAGDLSLVVLSASRLWLSWLPSLVLALHSLMLLSAIALSILMLLQRRTGAGIFSVGILGFVVMASLATLSVYGVLPISFWSRYGYEIGLTIQVDLLAVAVIRRIYLSERDRLRMQAEVARLSADMQARSEFVDRVTHDIKSPLTAVLGAEHLLRHDLSVEQRNRYLDMINSACGVVISIVDDILDHSRIRQGRLSLQNSWFSLRELLADIETATLAMPLKRDVTFSVKLDPALPDTLYGDKLRLSRVLTNLLTNAIKFTDHGNVGLAVTLLEKQAAAVTLQCVVTDTGIGMSDEFLVSAFDAYTREEERAGRRSGFGLGLAICKELVDMMGGTIDASSTPGQGSRFTVTLVLATRD